ncbi:tetratricopeptide repeat protein [Streptomyces polygonati]|uniref:Tetratricopeptide repeat protein n=1 Tax=Streptomyces polygonati TaxID=1617087 RepID=A0ABV8HZA4_9ACTN
MDATFNGSSQGQYGDGNIQYNFADVPRSYAAWPHQVGVIPPRAGCFQDRAEAARLRSAVDGGGTAVLGQVLTGMGGVGKTQLAAEYARSALAAGDIDVLVWISASNRTATASGYAQAGVEVLGADPGDPDRAAARFLAWLEPRPQERPCRWLVVLDDVADPADLDGLWPPASPHGRTLVTTRRRDAALTGHGRRLITVGEFTPGEAVEYLTAALAVHARTEPDEQLAALAAELGHLPLALSQAAAYLVDAGIGCAAYRKLLADRARTLADASPDALPDGQTHTMAAAWALSVDQADRLRPTGLARPMLELATFLDPNGIPATVLTSEPALAHLSAARTAEVTAEEATGALRALHRLSLIDHDPDAPSPSVRTHALIQRTTRETLAADQYGRLARTAGDALLAAWPDIERDTALARTLRANATALTTLAEDALHQPDAHSVLYRLGKSLGESGQVSAACDYFQYLVDTTHSHLGDDHLDTLLARSYLASWRGEAGDAAGAVATYTELLAHRERLLGPDHRDTLTTRNNLASWRGEAGDAAGAATAFAELLTDRERILGPDHPNTVRTRNNLAYWREQMADNPAVPEQP